MRSSDEVKVNFHPIPGGPDCREEAARAVEVITDELNAMKRRVAAMERAFPVDTWKEPDFAGHLTDHTRRAEDEKLMAGYKNEAAKKVVGGGVIVFLALLGTGALDWLKAHLK